MQALFMTLSMMTAIFLILLVLVQRGRGGGLTGALGGMGGQSAFGSKAGDLFTRITIGVAAFWIVLSVLSIKVLNTPEKVFGNTDKTTFDDTPPMPQLITDPAKVPPSATTGDETTSESSDEPAAAATSADAPAVAEPPAPSAAESDAKKSSEATPEKNK
jgi:preprotein translocase subunit SecG